MKFVLLESNGNGGVYVSYFSARNFEDAWRKVEDGEIILTGQYAEIILTEKEYISMCKDGIKKGEQEEPKEKPKLKHQIRDLIEKVDTIEIKKIYSKFKEPKEEIDNAIKKLLEDGDIYEPRPSVLRWLG